MLICVAVVAFMPHWQRPYKDGGPARYPRNLPNTHLVVRVLGSGKVNDPRSAPDVGWTTEIALPFQGLWAFHSGAAGRLGVRGPRDGEYFRVNFSRVHWPHVVVRDAAGAAAYAKAPGAREDNWVWCATGAVDAHVPHKYGHVRFSEALCGGPAAAAALASGPPPPPSSWCARSALMAVYEAQARRLRRPGGGWYARSVEELADGDAAFAAVAASVARSHVCITVADGAHMTSAADGARSPVSFVASCELPDASDALMNSVPHAVGGESGPYFLHVTQDGRLYADARGGERVA